MSRCFFAIFMLAALWSGHALAEDTVIYSYVKSGLMPAQWAVLPVAVDLSDTSPAALFETLRRKKMPTYGTSQFDAAKNRVTMDDSKCAYAAVVSAEIGMTFAAHGIAQPKILCGGQEVPPAAPALTHYVAVVPLWQALQAARWDGPALVQVGQEMLTDAVFRDRLKKHDKSLVRAIEANFADPNVFVKTGTMKGYIAQKFPGAEKRVARELTSGSPSHVGAAIAALAETRDASVVKQIKEILQKDAEHREPYSIALISAADAGLRAEAMRILLQSADDSNFRVALDDSDAATRNRVLQEHASQIFAASSPEHARLLMRSMAASGTLSPAVAWISETPSTPASQAAAEELLALSPENRIPALRMLVQNDDPDRAFDAIDELRNAAPEDAVWKRAAQSPHLGIRMMAEMQRTEPESKPGTALWETARSASETAVQELTKRSYDADLRVRRDVARATQWLDTSADSLRSVLLHDSDTTVFAALLAAIAKRPAEQISPALVREITARKEPDCTIAALFALPALMNEKTTQSITAFASNEMFHDDVRVKIAAIRALGEIARRTNDPVIADNAKTSLSLTLQDKSPSIVHHTKKALGVN